MYVSYETATAFIDTIKRFIFINVEILGWKLSENGNLNIESDL